MGSAAAVVPYSTSVVRGGRILPVLDRPVVDFAIGPWNAAAIQEDGSVATWGNFGMYLNGLKTFAKPVRKVALSQ